MKEKRRVLQAGEEKKKSCSVCVCEREQRKAMCFSLVVETHEEEKFGAFSMASF